MVGWRDQAIPRHDTSDNVLDTWILATLNRAEQVNKFGAIRACHQGG